MTTISPEPTAYLLQKWERFFMTDELTFTDAELEAWDCDIGHLMCEAHASEDAYLHALGERCAHLEVLCNSAARIIDDIRKGAQCR